MACETIYVKLLDEGVDVWRPVKARKIKDNIFEILEIPEYVDFDEKWEFPPNTIVVCNYQIKSEGLINIAIKKYNEE
jgi:hypothetical protein